MPWPVGVALPHPSHTKTDATHDVHTSAGHYARRRLVHGAFAQFLFCLLIELRISADWSVVTFPDFIREQNDFFFPGLRHDDLRRKARLRTQVGARGAEPCRPSLHWAHKANEEETKPFPTSGSGSFRRPEAGGIDPIVQMQRNVRSPRALQKIAPISERRMSGLLTQLLSQQSQPIFQRYFLFRANQFHRCTFPSKEGKSGTGIIDKKPCTGTFARGNSQSAYPPAIPSSVEWRGTMMWTRSLGEPCSQSCL
jgi:hypothetical protein